METLTTDNQDPESKIQNPSAPIRKASSQEWLWLDLDLFDYTRARDLQLQFVNARREGNLETDAVLFLEHPSVFTLGRRGNLKNQKVSKSFLESRGIPVIRVERGGDITYHGPGQLVIYPIVDLKASGWRVVEFVEALEEVMIRTLMDWGIKAERNPKNRGVWVDTSKIGSVGIAVRRSVSFHGLALNVNTELEPFTWVHPCGLQGACMTSMKEIMGKEIAMEDVRRTTATYIQEIFGVHLKPKVLDDILNLLGTAIAARNRKAI
jgi:lipoate-protein ligase B